MSKRPIVIDVEASGLHPDSFPLSVAWGSTLDNIEHHLIRPEAAWLAFTHAWDPAAERLHGLSRARLDTEGKPALWVAQRLATVLADSVIYSDAPEHDRSWLARLHECTGVPQCYRIVHIDQQLPRLYHTERNPHAYYALREHAFARCKARRHSADGDVSALLTLLQIAGC